MDFRRTTILALAAVCLAAACDEPPSPPAQTGRCQQALDNAIALRNQRDTPLPASPEQRAQRKERLARAVGNDYLAACDSAPDATVDCILAAKTTDELDACPKLPDVAAPQAAANTAGESPLVVEEAR